MNRYKPLFAEKKSKINFQIGTKDVVKNLQEKTDVKPIIKELIDTGWSGDNEAQMKAVQLLKGLATSEDPMSNKFMKKLDDFTSGLGAGDFE